MADQPRAVRLIAATVFVLTAAMDGLDGFIARRLNQRSRLGAILDPIADKGLVMTAIVVLALSDRSEDFPVWFPIAVIGRDTVLVIGFLALSKAIGRVEIRPSKIGKTATLLQIAAILWLLLGIRHTGHILLAALATSLTVASGAGIRRGRNSSGPRGGPSPKMNSGDVLKAPLRSC